MSHSDLSLMTLLSGVEVIDNRHLMDDIVLKRRVLPFPAELRNMIYRYLVRKTYLVYWPLLKGKHSPDLDAELSLSKALVECPILHVSKTTRKEALALLYTESTFRYWVDRTRQSYHYRDTCPGKEILDMVQNIEIHVSVPNLLSDVPSLVTVQTCEEITDKLNQNLAPRHSLVIRFYDCDATASSDNALPLYRTLAKLTRFNTVTVEICGGAYRPYADQNIPLAKARTMIQPGILSHITAECDRLKKNAINAMEPMLGPVMEEGEVESVQHVCYARYFKFDPQKAALHSITAAAEELLIKDGGRGCNEEHYGVYERPIEPRPLEHTTRMITKPWETRQ